MARDHKGMVSLMGAGASDRDHLNAISAWSRDFKGVLGEPRPWAFRALRFRSPSSAGVVQDLLLELLAESQACRHPRDGGSRGGCRDAWLSKGQPVFPGDLRSEALGGEDLSMEPDSDGTSSMPTTVRHTRPFRLACDDSVCPIWCRQVYRWVIFAEFNATMAGARLEH